jgi:type I restriction enzyme S subunit
LFNEGGDRDKLGRGWVWENQITPCITQNHVFRASTYLGLEAHAKFISHWGNTFGQKYFDRSGKQTTNLASINKTVLSNFPVPLPSLPEQEKILEEIEKHLALSDKLEIEIDTAVGNAEVLRQSIIKKAFSGQLVAQNENDESASSLLERIRAAESSPSVVKKRQAGKKNNAKKKETIVTKILDVLQSEKSWISTTELCRRCGISNAPETDEIEVFYQELRNGLVTNMISIERRGDEDWLRIKKSKVA